MNQNFKPTIWKEDTPPEKNMYYEMCEVCTPKSRLIWGEGNPKSKIMIVLDNPGALKNNFGEEYVCGTRITLQTALNKIGLTENEVYITYLLKCRPLKKYDKHKAREFSKPYLQRQIYDIKPQVLILLGDTVSKCMFENDKANVKTMRGRWHKLYKIPTIVSYHPLAVRRRPNLSKAFQEDFYMLSAAWNTLI